MASGALVDYSNEGAAITIDDRVYVLKPLTLGDRAAVEKFLRQERIQLILDQVRTTPLPDEVVGSALARAAAEEITLRTLLLSDVARTRLLYESLHRSDPTITWRWVCDKMPRMAVEVLVTLLDYLTGVTEEPQEAGENPTTSTPVMSLPESDGASSLGSSASNSV